MSETVDASGGGQSDDDRDTQTSDPGTRDREPRERRGVLQAGAIALVLSVAVNVALATVARMAEIGEGLMAMTYPSVLLLTAVAVVGAVAVYLALRWVTSSPDRIFLAVAAVVLVVSVVPDFTYVPAQPGGSVTAGAVLALMHVATAAIVVWQIVDVDRLRQSTSA